MARKTGSELIAMFAERKALKFGPTSGCAWSQRNGTEATHFWISKKQCRWVQGVEDDDSPSGIAIIDSQETKWILHQTSTKSNNGAGLVKLVR